eukprot:TRINITY_DN1140_c0_g1_i1.p1 TRINITY_DN1140_c0_g1~~TRINITY_DN1140_c0_g1_i1.p1  ORF type:complete len:170 (-),score=25.39 TRINITY_DN1140_c0_g1_i1:74-583(-)
MQFSIKAATPKSSPRVFNVNFDPDEGKEGAKKVHCIPHTDKWKPKVRSRADTEEAVLKKDLEELPEESYALEVEGFGAAILRGFGWKDGDAIGKDGAGLTAPIQYLARGQRLGLGAQPVPLLEGSKEARKQRDTLVAPKTADGKQRSWVTLDEEAIKRRKILISAKKPA